MTDATHEQQKRGSKISEEWVIEKIKGSKTDAPASDEEFKAALENDLWYYDPGMARYILCRLNESFKTREYDPNLWRQDEKGRFVWTVEHILPQTENLKKEWVEMLANGDCEKATEIQSELVHSLGNLTLTAYNSKLSDQPFARKQQKATISVDGDKLSIGYKNYLPINNINFKVGSKMHNLSNVNKWTESEIKSRNKVLIERCMNIFKI